MTGLVSIITPTFNSSKFIGETIQSVQNQSYDHWELIIVDDASTDSTVELIKAQVKCDHRIKLFQLDCNSGPAVARNMGIDAAKGKYLTFLDADDIWFEDFLENSINSIKKEDTSFVFSSYKRSNESLEFTYPDFIVPQKVTYTDILKTNSISCLTAFLDIEVLGKKYMPLIRKRQDMGLWLQYLKDIPFAFGIQEPKAIYRIRENSLSRNKTNLITYQWEFYRQVEQLNVFKSMYYMLFWMYNGFRKYRN
ncbi:glycosyltransferase family 2 protein [Gaetbulibacter saemankumensis]|uniref:glycosyltransferase family 2 protein n=1 Tax=Gaetbulibacter saemankumensis TaxID=311208 RepID=UPI00040D8F63|nr:glycosyltransferase family 2 protein [Gaetbulibacter saemankumensis]